MVAIRVTGRSGAVEEGRGGRIAWTKCWRRCKVLVSTHSDAVCVLGVKGISTQYEISALLFSRQLNYIVLVDIVSPLFGIVNLPHLPSDSRTLPRNNEHFLSLFLRDQSEAPHTSPPSTAGQTRNVRRRSRKHPSRAHPATAAAAARRRRRRPRRRKLRARLATVRCSQISHRNNIH
jgi:hypothetical protein